MNFMVLICLLMIVDHFFSYFLVDLRFLFEFSLVFFYHFDLICCVSA